jgi:hypothetical protein
MILFIHKILSATLILFMTITSCVFAQEYPTGVKFDVETIQRKGHFGDNWCQTWAADDNIYTMLDDGNGWWGSKEKLEGLPDYEGSMLLQISGDQHFSAEAVRKMPGWPINLVNSPLYAYGILAVDSTIYIWLWKSETDNWYSRAVGNRLLYTKDFGKTVYRWNGQLETHKTFQEIDSTAFFFYKDDPRPKEGKDAYAFNWIAFCQNGKANSAARDDYIYMYSPEQYDPQNLAMLRVHKNFILDKSRYQYFKGWKENNTEWTSNIRERGAVFRFPDAPGEEEWMWASWFPSVVFNPDLGLYLMVSYGIIDPKRNFWDNWCQDCEYPASLGFWYAENPWGPWNPFFYTDHFYAGREANRTYGFKLNPKWISEDGRKMVLIWSDAGDNHSTNYKWNQMEIEIVTDE